MIRAKNLTYSHAGKKLCLDNISFAISAGEIVGIVGDNGEGKSTLLKLMIGFYPVTEGSLEVAGKSPFSDPEVLENVFYINVENFLSKSITVKNYLDYLSALYPHYSKESEKKLVKALAVDINKKMSSLSTGHFKRVELVAAISSRAKIIILDEVFAVLDPKARKFIIELLKDHVVNFKVGIIVASNITDDLVIAADRILYLENKKINELKIDEYQKKIA